MKEEHEGHIPTNRLEAFSDGVLAIIITIMVLELKVPHGDEFSALLPLAPKFFSYVLSFVFVGIYWNNHHHMLAAARAVSGGVLWANLFLLFFLSLIPFTTAWMGENHFSKTPTALYGMNLLVCAMAYNWLARELIKIEGPNCAIAKAYKEDKKSVISLSLYVIAVAVAMVLPFAALALYAIVAVIWILPDKRIERILGKGRK